MKYSPIQDLQREATRMDQPSTSSHARESHIVVSLDDGHCSEAQLRFDASTCLEHTALIERD